MWDYALLSKIAKKFGVPAMFVATIFTVGRIYERREDIISGGVEIIESIKAKVIEMKNEKKIDEFKEELINGIIDYDKKSKN